MDEMTMLRGARSDVATGMRRFVGRYAEKTFDWDAFPSNRGFDGLERAQIRYVGAGGSPKLDDPDTLPPGRFTLSMIHQPPGKYAAAHAHEIEELFLVLGGVLTIAWCWDDEVLEARLGPKDMCLNAIDRAHGFRNDGVEPALMSIMVGSGKPLPPRYVVHPRDADPVLASHFGATAATTHRLQPESGAPHHRDFARHVIRYSEQPFERNPAGFARKVYIGEGGAPAGTFRTDLVHLPPGAGVRVYERDVEDVYLVLEGVLTIGWEENGRIVEQHLGPRDMIFNPPGRLHHFRNDDVVPVQFMMVVGKPAAEDVSFRAA